MSKWITVKPASAVLLIMLSVVFTSGSAWAGKKDNNSAVVKKPRPKAGLNISSPQKMQKNQLASPQRKRHVVNTQNQLAQARTQLQQARSQLAAARAKPGGNMTRDQVNSMPNGPAKTQALNNRRQVKWAETNVTKMQRNVSQAQQQFNTAVSDLQFSFSKRAAARSAPPRGAQRPAPAAQRAAIVPAPRARVMAAATPQPLPAPPAFPPPKQGNQAQGRGQNQAPSQAQLAAARAAAAARQRAQAAAAKPAFNPPKPVFSLPPRNQYDRVPPLPQKTLAPKLALQRRLASLNRQQVLFSPRN
jgi:hypothetical protein